MKNKLPPLRRLLARGRYKGHDGLCSRFTFHDRDRMNKCSCGRDDAEQQLNELESQLAEAQTKIADLQDEVNRLNALIELLESN